MDAADKNNTEPGGDVGLDEGNKWMTDEQSIEIMRCTAETMICTKTSKVSQSACSLEAGQV
jgi:hypothetical protein